VLAITKRGSERVTKKRFRNLTIRIIGITGSTERNRPKKRIFGAKKLLNSQPDLFKISPAWNGPFQTPLMIFRFGPELKVAFDKDLTMV
jgi:hypothetical protein